MSQAQETYATLMEVDKLLANIELRIDNISKKVGTSDTGGGTGDNGISLRQQVHTLNIGLSIVTATANSKDLNGVSAKISQLISVMMQAERLAIIISEIQAGAIGGPWGLLYGGASMAAFAISVNNLGQ